MQVFKTTGTCAQEIAVELDGDRIKRVQFVGGCNGNLTGVTRLIEGMTVSEAIEKLRGIDCGGRGTSCPDQLSYALEKALKGNAQA